MLVKIEHWLFVFSFKDVLAWTVYVLGQSYEIALAGENETNLGTLIKVVILVKQSIYKGLNS